MTETSNITLDILALERDSLIRKEVMAANQRKQLERAAIAAVLKLGHNINDVSEATGLTTVEIRRLIELPQELGNDLKVLAGVC
jgi:hypothetical protein